MVEQELRVMEQISAKNLLIGHDPITKSPSY